MTYIGTNPPTKDQILLNGGPFDTKEEAERIADWYSTTNEVGGIITIKYQNKFYAVFNEDYLDGYKSISERSVRLSDGRIVLTPDFC